MFPLCKLSDSNNLRGYFLQLWIGIILQICKQELYKGQTSNSLLEFSVCASAVHDSVIQTMVHQHGPSWMVMMTNLSNWKILAIQHCPLLNRCYHLFTCMIFFADRMGWNCSPLSIQFNTKIYLQRTTFSGWIHCNSKISVICRKYCVNVLLFTWTDIFTVISQYFQYITPIENSKRKLRWDQN